MRYDFDGQKYAHASAHQTEWGAKLIRELELQGNESVLDLGCGDGTLTAQIAEQLPRGHVVGIDASRGMIDAALPKSRENLRFVLMDINALEFFAEFDVVFSNATLHWVKDHWRLYQNLCKSLRDNGRVRFNFAADGNCSSFFKVIREAISNREFSAYFADFVWPWYMPAVNEYAALVKSSGLTDVQVWGENADRFFADTDAMIRWVDQPSIVPFLVCVPDGQKREFRDFVVSRMIEETKQDDGRCFETFRRLNVYAGK